MNSQLESLTQLEPGWDGYRGIPVGRRTADLAQAVLDAIQAAGFPEPQIVPGSGGELQLEWHTPDATIELFIASKSR